jgi:lipid-A-disaccharide synthase
MIVVGEASGDLHGARMVRALVAREPTLEVFGVAGAELKREKVRVLFDVARLTGMGLAELLGNLKTLWDAYRILRGALEREKPDLLILIDFPEFNLRLARVAKRLGIPVLYYIGPQVWAWRARRVKQIGRWIDRLAVVFPFEVPIYEKEGVRVAFVGHPLLDVVRSGQSREATLKRHGLDPAKRTITLLPGSRRREIAYHLPPMLEAARRLREEMDVQFILARASTVDRGQIEPLTAGFAVPVAIAEGNAYDVVSAADLVWLSSGTATLETALLLKPMVIVYRVAWLTYALARLLVRVDHIGMVNILSGEAVVPELIQGDVTAGRIIRETRGLLRDASRREAIVAKLGRVREKLGVPGAAGRVAEIALEMMGKSQCKMQIAN